MNLELIDGVFHDLFDNELSLFIWAGKFLAIIVFMFTIGKKAFKSFSSHGVVFGKDQEGLTPYDIVRGLIILAVILSITEILTLVDSILLLIEDVGRSTFVAEMNPLSLYEAEIKPPDTGSGSFDIMIEYLRKLNENFNPTMWVLKGFYLLLWLFDIVLFTVFIARRFFFMGVIKLFSPIILALSMLPEYKDLSYNLGKVYLRNFLVIIPYLLVFVFANRIHDAMVEAGMNAWGGVAVMGERAIRVVGLLAAVLIKFTLLKKSSDIMKQLIP